MREYGQVQSAFWQSPDAQSWTDSAKLLALYLLTGPHANGLGCYRLPDGYIMADLGWDAETVSEGFAELSRNGFAYRFEGVVFTPNFLRWNRIANGNIAKARFAEFESLPKGEAKVRVARTMLEFSTQWSIEDRTVLETVSQTVSERYANQNPTLPNPTQKEPTLAQPAARRVENPPAEFEQFWSIYPKHQGKQAAVKAFVKLAPDHDLLGVMLAAVNRQRQSEQWQRDGGQFVPHAATWLNGRRWEDEIRLAPHQGHDASRGVSGADSSDMLRRAI
ncbi:hypothetical protein GCM10007862_07170 [Dyella lipolytica]|uniref:Helix-turn-helix domain-containing protein n=1 Tax=Dyella lipolytica TaxID=1867835 RepID=A0ABW8J0B6_9GAMM|nr:hypothetical protein [Dyella lipolytica]GLQ45666.1 hypothetical protein GCM10007862_07170 [Dyella lipolytica]